MTLLLLFLAGFAAAYTVALKVRTTFALREYEQEIPDWVNQGNRPVIISLADREQDIDFRIWELEMEDR